MKKSDSIITPLKCDEDLALDISLRPKAIDEFIGQDKVKENLSIYIQAAKKRGDPLDHVLLYGPPGVGKTTLSYIIAHELNVNIRTTTGPAFTKAADLASILTNMQPHDILFIDEVHRLNKTVEESLYPAMEDYKLHIILGKGPSATTMKLSLPKFTLIAATTRIGLLSSPLRERFGIIFYLNFYNTEELKHIIKRNAKILNVEITEDGAEELAKRARGTPRIANRLLKRTRDYAEVKANGIINEKIADESLKLLEVDSMGLDSRDRELLLSIIEKYDGGPVGIDTLSASLSEEKDTIEEVYEPYLLQIGFLKRTPKGRYATALAYKHLGISKS